MLEMRMKTLMLGALPAALLLPTITATSSSAQYYSNSQPELAQKPAIHAPQEIIKLKFLKLDTTPIAKMSESSAVRMACGAAAIQIYNPSRTLQFTGSPAPAPAPARTPVHVSASVHGRRVTHRPGLPVSTRSTVTKPRTQVHTPYAVHPMPIPTPMLIH
jgi:hypothetical protein